MRLAAFTTPLEFAIWTLSRSSLLVDEGFKQRAHLALKLQFHCRWLLELHLISKAYYLVP
jgi:hypothetical protein